MCLLSHNMWASISWKPQGLCLLYLAIIAYQQNHVKYVFTSLTLYAKGLAIFHLKVWVMFTWMNYTYEPHRWTVHFVKSLQILTNKCTYITFTWNTLKHIKLLRHVSISSDHHQRVSSFLAFVYKNQPNREYVITLARNDETPWYMKYVGVVLYVLKSFKWKLYRCICWLIFEVNYT